MSRIGKKAVAVPAGVTVNVSGQNVTVKGPKGELKLALVEHVLAKLDKGAIKIDPRDQTKLSRSCWGMSRTMVANLVKGVTEGYSHTLEIQGVGYKAAIKGKIHVGREVQCDLLDDGVEVLLEVKHGLALNAAHESLGHQVGQESSNQRQRDAVFPDLANLLVVRIKYLPGVAHD